MLAYLELAATENVLCPKQGNKDAQKTKMTYKIGEKINPLCQTFMTILNYLFRCHSGRVFIYGRSI